MKAKIRKRVEVMLNKARGRQAAKLRWEYERKGFLSKREIKILMGLGCAVEAKAS